MGPELTLTANRSVLSAEAIRTLTAEDREALIVHATTPAVLTRMTRHYESPHAGAYATAVADAQHLLATANGHPANPSAVGSGSGTFLSGEPT